MALAYTLLTWLHWGGLAAIVAGYIFGFTGRGIHPLMVWGARVQLLVGLALVGTIEMGDLGTLNHVWVALKLVVALAIVGLCEAAAAKSRKGAPVPALVHAAAGLTVVNVLIAFFAR